MRLLALPLDLPQQKRLVPLRLVLLLDRSVVLTMQPVVLALAALLLRKQLVLRLVVLAQLRLRGLPKGLRVLR